MAEAQFQRRLAAILAADVVGYSRLMGIDEGDTLARLKALRRDIIDPAIEAHRGRTVKLMGDGSLVEFQSAVDAVTCAAEVQDRVRACEAGRAENDRIALRIGVNIGDIIIDGEDLYGDGVNIAARLEALAEPGGVLLSRAAADQVRGKIPFALESLGEQNVKNIARPVEVFRLVSTATAGARQSSAPAPSRGERPAGAEKPSIAVLAFTNMSGDPQQEYFSDGISEDIITDLSKLPALNVIARNSSFTYKGRAVDVKQVSRELGVRYILEGSIRKAGNRVRVTAQLIDGSSGGHLWAERYDRDLTDIFAVQDDLTRHIVAALKLTLTDRETAALGAAGTRNVAAHDLFLKGRELMFAPRKDRAQFEEWMDCFRRAIALDPDYGAPYAGLAMSHMFDYQNRWSDAPEHALDEAWRLVQEAIARDDKDPFAHYVAAAVSGFKRDYATSVAEAEKALALNPNYALAHSTRGLAYVFAGEPLKAIPWLERAMRLDPAQSQYLHFLGTAFFLAGHYATAAARFRERIAVNPGTDMSRGFLIAALGQLGEQDEARRVWRELQAINPRYSLTEHVARLPFKNPADAEKFALGFEKAGVTA